MKKITFIYSFALLLLFGAGSCTVKDGIDKDLSFLGTASSSNIDKVFTISNDNSGKVLVTPSAEGATSFLVDFGNGAGGSSSATVSPGGTAVHYYPEGDYTVSITATDIAGKTSASTYPLKITYRAPENLAVTTNQNVHHLEVSAKADYAASFMVYFGDVSNEQGTPLAKGASVSHDYANSGYYTVKVVALSGGAATSSKDTQVKITDLFKLPIDFESEFVTYFFGTFGGGQQFATVDNPNPSGLDTSAKVGKFTRGFEWWSGTYSPLNAPIDFSVGKVIKVLVYNPDPAQIGMKLNVELESATGGNPANGVGVLKEPVTTSGAWEELVFDFSTIPGIPADAKFNQLVLRFNDAADGAGPVIYVDNFRLTN